MVDAQKGDSQSGGGVWELEHRRLTGKNIGREKRFRGFVEAAQRGFENKENGSHENKKKSPMEAHN